MTIIIESAQKPVAYIEASGGSIIEIMAQKVQTIIVDSGYLSIKGARLTPPEYLSMTNQIIDYELKGSWFDLPYFEGVILDAHFRGDCYISEIIGNKIFVKEADYDVLNIDNPMLLRIIRMEVLL